MLKFWCNLSDDTFLFFYSYKLDETSPEDTDEEVFCYEILSKVNIKFIAPIA